MNIELVSVGTELLLGEIVNQNVVYLAKFCKELGFHVFFETTVGDNPLRLQQCLEQAFARGADIIITTGGIGPTNDDLTKEISAKVLSLPMEYREEEAKKIKDKILFLHGGKHEVAKSNFKQAYFAKGAYILDNAIGTANACVIQNHGRMIVNLPGPPVELQHVVEMSLRPYLQRLTYTAISCREFVVFTSGESQLADELADLLAQQQAVTLALYAAQGYVRLRLATQQPTQQSALQKLDEWETYLRAVLKERLLPLSALKQSISLPPFALDLGSCSFLNTYFQQSGRGWPIDEKASYRLQFSLKKMNLGEIVQVEAQFGSYQADLTIPCLYKAEANIEKITQKLFFFLRKISLEVAHNEHQTTSLF